MPSEVRVSVGKNAQLTTPMHNYSQYYGKFNIFLGQTFKMCTLCYTPCMKIISIKN